VSRTVWSGRPWVLPRAVVKSVVIIAVAVVTFWLEVQFGVAYVSAPVMPVLGWTALVLLTAWVVTTVRSLMVRASRSYVLMEDALEVRVGIVASKSFVISPAGFSELEVSRSLTARIVGSGDIVIRTQGESDIRLERVRHPVQVAAQIRDVMARPFARPGRPALISERTGYPAESSSR
jgi:uncharacterized membrane protein YdbT with pleckstrin-like domain